MYFRFFGKNLEVKKAYIGGFSAKNEKNILRFLNSLHPFLTGSVKKQVWETNRLTVSLRGFHK